MKEYSMIPIDLVEDYTDQTKAFQKWFCVVADWLKAQGYEGHLVEHASGKLAARIRLSDFSGRFHTDVTPLKEQSSEGVDGFRSRVFKDCSRAVASARKDRMLAFNKAA